VTLSTAFSRCPFICRFLLHSVFSIPFMDNV
jgi:hypothetical protein